MDVAQAVTVVIIVYCLDISQLHFDVALLVLTVALFLLHVLGSHFSFGVEFIDDDFTWHARPLYAYFFDAPYPVVLHSFQSLRVATIIGGIH